jgi:ribonuclease HI
MCSRKLRHYFEAHHIRVLTNNIAEYEAILLGLQKFGAIGVQTCVLRMDSKVVSEKIEEECIAREPTLEKISSLSAQNGKLFQRIHGAVH